MKQTQRSNYWLDYLLSMITQHLRPEVFSDVWSFAKRLIQLIIRQGPYVVLQYESTLELIDCAGLHAEFQKYEKVRYLQDNIIAYQDQAWGDRQSLVNYRRKPGKLVGCYRTGYKWRALISRRKVKNKGEPISTTSKGRSS